MERETEMKSDRDEEIKMRREMRGETHTYTTQHSYFT